MHECVFSYVWGCVSLVVCWGYVFKLCVCVFICVCGVSLRCVYGSVSKLRVGGCFVCKVVFQLCLRLFVGVCL